MVIGVFLIWVVYAQLKGAFMLQITLDGPSGSGKSTVAKLIAQQLDITYLDTGAMYRSLTYDCMTHQVDVHDTKAVIDHLNQFELAVDGSHVFVNGQDVSNAIRTEAVSQNVSAIASIPQVRIWMVKKQQAIGSQQPIVMDGRDIGTVVLKDAPFKFFLTATVEVRARRRYEEQVKKGHDVSFDQIKEDIALRDHKDSTRDHSPLIQAEDAIEIDTSVMSIQEVVDFIVTRVKAS